MIGVIKFMESFEEVSLLYDICTKIRNSMKYLDILSELTKGVSLESIDEEISYLDLKWSANNHKDTPFSDCTIHVNLDTSNVKNKDPTDVEFKGNIFYVHKTILAVGQRRSKYFQQVFETVMKGGHDNEEDGFVSNIELTEEESKVFPMILDFIYHENNARIKDIDLKANNVLLLRHMSVYFGVADLFTKTNVFIADTMNKDNIIPYLLES